MRKKTKADSFRFVTILACLVTIGIVAPLTAYAQAAGISFTRLGDLTAGPPSSFAYGISADGTVIVGNGGSANGGEAFRWTEAEGMQGLGDLPGGVFSSASSGASADGSVIVGSGNTDCDAACSTNTTSYAVRWTNGAIQNLGDLPLSLPLSSARDVSNDGTVVVGLGTTSQGGPRIFEAVRWTNGGAPVGLGDLGGGAVSSRAHAVSADGSVVVGLGVSGGGPEAFRWEGSAMRGLGDLAGGEFRSEARGISADGLVIVGSSDSGTGGEAFRWTESHGMVGLGAVPGKSRSEALDVSADGGVIAGAVMTPERAEREAVVWIESVGVRSIQDILEVDGGIDMTGWTLTSAQAISDDGSIVAGTAINPDGRSEAWRANLGCAIGRVAAKRGSGLTIGRSAAECECQVPEISWTGVTSQSFDDPSNWVGGELPILGDFARFDLDGPHTIAVSDDHRIAGLSVGSLSRVALGLDGHTITLGLPCFRDPANALVVGDIANEAARLIVSTGRIESEDHVVAIGTGGAEGELRLEDSAILDLGFSNAGGVHVGQTQFSTGRLAIESGSMLRSTDVIVGLQAGSIGDAIVSGTDALLRTRLAIVGAEGSGTLTVSDAATAEIQAVTLGAGFGSVGHVLVDGPGSVFGFPQDGSLYVIGADGRGIFDVMGGATIDVFPDAQVFLGAGMGAGRINVEGSGTRFGPIGILTIGAVGEGVVHVDDGAFLSIGQMVISEGDDERVDSLVVSGRESRFEASAGDAEDDVKNVVGGRGQGVMQLALGASATISTSLAVGFQPQDESQSSSGRLNIVDLGTKMSIGRSLFVGFRLGLDATGGVVEGDLLVARGAELTVDGLMAVGFARDGHPEEPTRGAVEVTGGSQIRTNRILVVGNGGTVRVADGSQITVPRTVFREGAVISGRTNIIPPSTGKRSSAIAGHQADAGITTEELFIEDGAVVDFDSVFVEGGTLGGTITWPSSLTNTGVVSPGDSVGLVGTFMVSADYTQTQDGELRVDIGGVVADTRHDVLVVGGVATLSGTLSLEKAGGYEPAVGDRFVILTAGEVAGTFDAVDQPEGFTVAISYTGTTVEVRVASVVSIEQVEPTVVAESVVLHQNYPNPFAQTTRVSYSLAGPGYVRLTLFDLLGRQVADLDSGRRDAGRHEVVIDIGSLAQASNVGLPAGVYLYRIEVTRETQSEFAVRELVLTR